MNLLRVKYFCFQIYFLSSIKFLFEKDFLVSIILIKTFFNFPDTKGNFIYKSNLPLNKFDLQNQSEERHLWVYELKVHCFKALSKNERK